MACVSMVGVVTVIPPVPVADAATGGVRGILEVRGHDTHYVRDLLGPHTGQAGDLDEDLRIDGLGLEPPVP